MWISSRFKESQDSDNLIAPLGRCRLQPCAQATCVDAYVVIQNKNIGHSLIPEVRDLYEAWVEFTVKDAARQGDLPQRLPQARRHA